MKQNYQKELDKKIEKIVQSGEVPSLLIHSCCAPCSSYVLEYLSEYFSITVFFYNPNITDPEEYHKRVEEQKRLIAELPVRHPISFVEGTYEPERFIRAAKGMEQLPEGGARCEKCFELRLSETAKLAKQEGFDFFTTTLTISPLKNAEKLNEIGEQMAKSYEGTAFLNSDFKKKNGYKRSVELSGIYHLYRQDYCGCIYSKQERERQKKGGF
jgi:hypothetical protein